MVKEAVESAGFDLQPYSERIRKYSDPVALVLLSFFDALTEFDENEAREEAKELAVEHFQQKFAERFLTYPLMTFLLVLIVAVSDVLQCGALSNQMYGLSIDFLGAVVLGRGLLMGGVAIGAVSGQRWGYNPLLIKSLAKDSVDGVWGISLILIGIGIQIIALSQLYPNVPNWLVASC